MVRTVLGCALATGLLAAAANATTIDFNGFSSGTSYTQSGATITDTGGTGLVGSTDPNGTTGLLSATGPYAPLRADISGGTDFVSIDLGDFDSDPDLLFLDAYDSSNTLIGSTSLLIDASFSGMKTLSLSIAGIDYVIYGSTAPSLGGSSVYSDNFTFDSTPPPVPEPLTLALFGAGLAGAAAVRRRRKAAK